MYTPYDVADMLKIHYRTVMEWIHSGKIKAVKIGRTYRITDSEIDRIKHEGIKTTA